MQVFQVLVIAVDIYTSRIKLPVEMPIIPIISNSVEDARLVFSTTWIFPGVLVLQSSFSVKRLPCLVFHPGFQLFLFAIQHDDVTVTSKVECHVY